MTRAGLLLLMVASVARAQAPDEAMRAEARAVVMAGVSLPMTDVGQAFASVIDAAQRSGGAVLVNGCGAAAERPFSVAAGTTLEAALDMLTREWPEYTWAIQGKVVNLQPARGLPAAMRVPVERVAWNTADDLPASIGRLESTDAVKAAFGRLGLRPGLQSIVGPQAAPRVVDGVPVPLPRQGRPLQVEKVTVREALNAVAASYGKVHWVYRERSCGGQTEYTIAASRNAHRLFAAGFD